MSNAIPTFMDRIMAAIREIVRAELPQMTYSGPWEYQVTKVSSIGADVLIDGIATASIPLPNLVQIPLRPSISATKVSPVVGSKVLVEFINQDPTRPFIRTLDSQQPTDISFTTPSMEVHGVAVIDLAADFPFSSTVIRDGDLVTIGSTSGPIILTAGPTNSRVKA